MFVKDTATCKRWFTQFTPYSTTLLSYIGKWEGQRELATKYNSISATTRICLAFIAERCVLTATLAILLLCYSAILLYYYSGILLHLYTLNSPNSHSNAVTTLDLISLRFPDRATLPACDTKCVHTIAVQNNGVQLDFSLPCLHFCPIGKLLLPIPSRRLFAKFGTMTDIFSLLRLGLSNSYLIHCI